MSVRTPAQRRRRASTSTPSSTPSQQPERVPRVMELLTKSDLTEEDTRRIVPFLRDHSDEDTCPDRCTLQGKRYRVQKFYYCFTSPFQLLVLKSVDPKEYVHFIPHGDEADEVLIKAIEKMGLIENIKENVRKIADKIYAPLQSRFFIAGKKTRLSKVIKEMRNLSHIQETLRLGQVVKGLESTQTEHSNRLDEHDEKVDSLSNTQSQQSSELDEVKQQLDKLQINQQQVNDRLEQVIEQASKSFEGITQRVQGRSRARPYGDWIVPRMMPGKSFLCLAYKITSSFVASSGTSAIWASSGSARNTTCIFDIRPRKA